MTMRLEGHTSVNLSNVDTIVNSVKAIVRTSFASNSLHSESSRELCQVDDVLAPLIATHQWVCWRFESVPGAKPRKPPFNPTRGTSHPQKASAVNPRTWGSYVQASIFAKAAKMDGKGFVLTAELGLTLVDLDGCFDDAGNIEPWAAEIVEALNSYTELSPSGKGLHVLAWGRVAALKSERVEIYGDQRYTTITGRPFGLVKPIRECQRELAALRSEYAPHTPSGRKQEPQSTAPVDRDDASVISKLQSSPKYGPLWAGNATGDLSRADFSLCNGIAWLVGLDQERIERIFRESRLYRPEKHDRNSGGGHSNLAVTVHNAVNTWRGTLYQWPAPKSASVEPEPAPDPRPALAPQPAPTLINKLHALRLWLRHGGVLEYATSRSYSSVQAVLDALIERAIDRNSIEHIPGGLGGLQQAANLGSKETVRHALDKAHQLTMLVKHGDHITMADGYSIAPDVVEMAWRWALENGRIYTVSKSNPNHSKDNTVRFSDSVNLYSRERASDIFSTGLGGVGLAWGNQAKGLGKLPLQLLDLMLAEGLPMSVAQLATMTGLSQPRIRAALKKTFDVGLVDRQVEAGGRSHGVRYWYTVPDDLDERIANLAPTLKTYGVGLDRAIRGADALVGHTIKLLSEDEDPRCRRTLTDKQRAMLKAWQKSGKVDVDVLSQVAIDAVGSSPAAAKENISSSKGADLLRRCLSAVRQFREEILTMIEIPDAQMTRIFQYWSSVNGFPDLTVKSAGNMVAAALSATRTAKPPSALQPPAPRPPRVTMAELSVQRRLEPAAAAATRHGFTLSVAAHTVSRAEP